MDSQQVEHEICGNCKKEIPQHNYVMHTAHCARNITLCQVCKEPIPKSQYNAHKQKCVAVKPKIKKPEPPPSNLERSSYYQERKEIEDNKIAARNQRKLEKYERLCDTGYTLKSYSSSSSSSSAMKSPLSNNNSAQIDKSSSLTNGSTVKSDFRSDNNNIDKTKSGEPHHKSSGLLPCKYCDLELPKLELEEHENYCGSRTDKCLECGELVMYKYKQIHMDSNHGFLKLKDEPGPRASWDSTSQRSNLDTPSTPTRRRPSPLSSFTSFDPMPYLPSAYSAPSVASQNKEKGESYKEISRRLDSGPAPQPPRRRRNPPTELTIPCEFCQTPIPHEELIQHETGCRPDLARFNPRRRSPEEDDYFVAPQPSSPEVELPCEFCAEMIPSSQLLRHQATCI